MTTDSDMRLPAPSTELAIQQAIRDLQGESLRYAEASKALNTRKSYAYDWVQFSKWIADKYGVALPQPDEKYRVALEEAVHPAFVIGWLTDMATRRKSGTLNRYMAAVRHHHRFNGLASPTDHPQVSQVLHGIKREHTYKKAQPLPLYLSELQAAIGLMGDSLGELRDKTVLLVGWWGALRRSELVGLNVGDIGQHPEGVILHIGKSKTDQTGEGREVPIHYRGDTSACPVLALRTWLQAADIDSGAVVRRVGRYGNVWDTRLHPRWVPKLVKKAVKLIGLDPELYSAHSLRAGFVSEADRRGIPTAAVRAVTGHRSDEMLNSYSRPAQIFRDSAGAWFD